MASASTGVCVKHTGHFFDRNTLEARSDEELLEVFLGSEPAESEAAFKSLVVRHGPMVLGVCRHVLGVDHDAEDSFQAVFLVLARKAKTIRDRRLLASWLYEVAYRISVKARVESAKRRTRERKVVPVAADSFDPREDFDNNDAWNELRSVLQTEVDRLPDKYRTPVILCYLEGKTNAEAATILNWPIGSVKGRLARARDMLHGRLMRRNLVLSATFLLSAIHRETVFAEVVPSSLVDSTVRSSMSVVRKNTTEPSLASFAAVSLMEHYLTRSTARRLLTAVAAVVILAAFLAASRAAFFQDGFRSFQVQLGRFVNDTASTSTPPAATSCLTTATH